ncbi:MAG TPA: hypothetical protein PLD73_03890 [Candidatus Hydrogenedentes bacterium]|nr:hypothetical protein [Candidatus Hydrogenedentota bacterium]HPJ98477.1 hypothetical protein [Candidatus Hydrogenedentota bacterium]
MNEEGETLSRWAFWGHLAAAVWILGTTVLYFVRLSAVFFRDNHDTLNGLLERLGLGFLG